MFFCGEKNTFIMLDQRISLLKVSRWEECVLIYRWEDGFWWEFILLLWLPNFCDPFQSLGNNTYCVILVGKKSLLLPVSQEILNHFSPSPLGAKLWAGADPLDILSQPLTQREQGDFPSSGSYCSKEGLLGNSASGGNLCPGLAVSESWAVSLCWDKPANPVCAMDVMVALAN